MKRKHLENMCTPIKRSFTFLGHGSPAPGPPGRVM